MEKERLVKFSCSYGIACGGSFSIVHACANYIFIQHKFPSSFYIYDLNKKELKIQELGETHDPYLISVSVSFRFFLYIVIDYEQLNWKLMKCDPLSGQMQTVDISEATHPFFLQLLVDEEHVVFYYEKKTEIYKLIPFLLVSFFPDVHAVGSIVINSELHILTFKINSQHVSSQLVEVEVWNIFQKKNSTIMR